MKIQRDKIIKFLIVLVAITYIVISSKLDLFLENYSTLSLSTKGYFLCLFMGIITGLVFGYVTYKNTDIKYGIIIFLAMLIGTIIPHDITYNLQGSLHMFNAYLGFVGLEIIMFININKYKAINYKKANLLQNIFFLALVLAILSYCKGMCVNTLSELIVILSNLFIVFVIS